MKTTSEHYELEENRTWAHCAILGLLDAVGSGDPDVLLRSIDLLCERTADRQRRAALLIEVAGLAQMALSAEANASSTVR